HDRRDAVHKQVVTLEVGADHVIPPRLVAVEKVPRCDHVTGVVDQDVDAAEPADGGLDDALDIAGVAHIAGHAHGRPAGIGDLSLGSPTSVASDISDHDAGALGGVSTGNRVTDAVGAAGDDGDLAFQLVVRFAHVVPFVCSEHFPTPCARRI